MLSRRCKIEGAALYISRFGDGDDFDFAASDASRGIAILVGNGVSAILASGADYIIIMCRDGYFVVHGTGADDFRISTLDDDMRDAGEYLKIGGKLEKVLSLLEVKDDQAQNATD